MTRFPPFITAAPSVTQIMFRVLLALLPGVAAHAWFYGPAILVSLTLATVTALGSEAMMLRLRNVPIKPFLVDLSAVVTGWLLALSVPTLSPPWLVAAGTAFAIVVAKQLCGGLGNNPLNPAMAAYALLSIVVPVSTTPWEPDGKGTEIIAAAYLAGGLYLLQQRIINWRSPVAFLLAALVTATAFYTFDLSSFTAPWFTNGIMLTAFFILTDPVTGATTPKGKLIFAAGAGFLACVISEFSGNPGGMAFGILIMNMAVPFIDRHTRPPVFGYKK